MLYMSFEEAVNLLTNNELSNTYINELRKNPKTLFSNSILKLNLELSDKSLKVIWAALSLRYHMNDMQFLEEESYLKTDSIAELLFNEFRCFEQECFIGLYFNANMKLISKDLLSIGTADAVFLHTRDLFRNAMIYNATEIIISHNHPSGDPTPGNNDIVLTKKMIDVGKMIDIKIIDHIIIGNNTYVSMLKNKILNFS